jgi:hypothetical protein
MLRWCIQASFRFDHFTLTHNVEYCVLQYMVGIYGVLFWSVKKSDVHCTCGYLKSSKSSCNIPLFAL